MKTEAQQQSVLAARTTGLTTKKIALLTVCTDPADPATWTEAPDVATTNRPTVAFNAGGVTNDDTNNRAQVTWPAADMEITLASGATIVRLAICEGTGALSSAARSVSDSAFSVAVAAGGKLRIPANSQTCTEQ
jgi:hypothetical protein